MSSCRFMYANLVTDADQVTLSSARPGLVGLPAPRVQGSAVAYTDGAHTGHEDQVFLVEIDSVAAGSEVGQATFRWRRGGDTTWQATGLPTAETFTELADGVRIKWSSGPGEDFVLGDAWTILATRAFGAAALLDRDRDTGWEATGCAQEHITLDLGTARRVQALILADHNLSDTATATLMADDGPDWDAPAFNQSLALTRPHLVAFLDHSARYWRLSLADPDNPAGALSASLLYLGPYFQPGATFASRYQRGLVAGRAVNSTDAGKITGSARGLAWRWRLEFPRLSQDDLAGFDAMYRAIHDPASGTLSPVFFTPFADQPQDTLYCLPGPRLEPRHRHGGRFALTLELEEVIRSHA